MALVKIPDNRVEDFFEQFMATSAFTFEGLNIWDKEGIKAIEAVLRNTGYEQKHFTAYWYTGELMNSFFELTGSNAYPDDLIFLTIPDYYNPIVKLNLGARWFDDIVANNRIRQNGINGGINPDYGIKKKTDTIL